MNYRRQVLRAGEIVFQKNQKPFCTSGIQQNTLSDTSLRKRDQYLKLLQSTLGL